MPSYWNFNTGIYFHSILFEFYAKQILLTNMVNERYPMIFLLI